MLNKIEILTPITNKYIKCQKVGYGGLSLFTDVIEYIN